MSVCLSVLSRKGHFQLHTLLTGIAESRLVGARSQRSQPASPACLPTLSRDFLSLEGCSHRHPLLPQSPPAMADCMPDSLKRRKFNFVVRVQLEPSVTRGTSGSPRLRVIRERSSHKPVKLIITQVRIFIFTARQTFGPNNLLGGRWWFGVVHIDPRAAGGPRPTMEMGAGSTEPLIQARPQKPLPLHPPKRDSCESPKKEEEHIKQIRHLGLYITAPNVCCVHKNILSRARDNIHDERNMSAMIT